MAGVRRFRDLIAYQKARALIRAIYTLTRSFPREHRFEITAQINRAACSVALNIAEGYGIGTTAGMLRYLRIARGSLCETDAALEIATDLGLGSLPPEASALLAETDRVLQGLIRSLENQEQPNAV